MKLLLVALCLLVPSVAQAQTFDRIYTASEWAVFGGHIADGMTTQRVLGEQKGREAQWFLMRHTDPYAMAGLKTAGAVGTVWLTRKVKRAGHPRWALATNLGLSALLYGIAASNERIRDAASR